MTALDLRFYCNDIARDTTLREYLYTLLLTLWQKGENFNGKRPFGNSGWQFGIYEVLIKNGYLEGTLDDEEGYIETCDLEVANTLVCKLIMEMFNERPDQASTKID